ncbi:hypothetical protein [Roseateles sp. PN1]|uniref:hypothetical protein n=1 Tax=Roseateles sp. PN1 TaxID=3137372 RepID=UPI003139C212
MTKEQLEQKFADIQLALTSYSEYSDEISFNYFKPSLNAMVQARVFVDLRNETPAEKISDFLLSATTDFKKLRNDKLMSDFKSTVEALPFCERVSSEKRLKNLMLFRAQFPDLEIEDWEDIGDEEIDNLANFQVEEIALITRLRGKVRDDSNYEQFDFAN